MSVFVWEGKATDGKTVKGEMEAANIQQVFNNLKAQKISANPKKIKEKGSGMQKELKIPGFGAKVKTKDIVIFTRQFATMIDAGLPLIQGLQILGQEHENPAMRKTLIEVQDFVQNGGTLADGMSKHPKAFDNLFVNMIAAGEIGGILDIILERLAEYLEKSDKLKRQVKSAMIYPSIVVAVAVIVSSILLIFVVPTFADMFADFGQALPAPTQFVMNLSQMLVNHGLKLAGAGGVGFWLFRRFARTDRGKEVIHPLLLKLPVFGNLIRKTAVARFSRTMGTMLSSGVPILESLNICGKTAGNKVVEHEIFDVRLNISEGKTMAEPLKGSKIFPPMVVQMINVGESTGALDAMLGKVADFYDDEVETAVGAMKQLIEPVMIVVLGVLIGGLVIAMYLPIFKLGGAM